MSDFQYLRLLRAVRMVRAFVDLELGVHRTTERVFRQHALDRGFDHALGVLGQKILQRDRLDVADVAGVVVIDLVVELVAGDCNLLRVDYDEIIARVAMRGVDRLMLAAQTAGELGGKATQRLVAGVDEVPVALDRLSFGTDRCGFHIEPVPVRALRMVRGAREPEILAETTPQAQALRNRAMWCAQSYGGVFAHAVRTIENIRSMPGFRAPSPCFIANYPSPIASSWSSTVRSKQRSMAPRSPLTPRRPAAWPRRTWTMRHAATRPA